MNRLLEQLLSKELRAIKKSAQLLSTIYQHLVKQNGDLSLLFTERLNILKNEQERFATLPLALLKPGGSIDTRAMRSLMRFVEKTNSDGTIALQTEAELLVACIKMEYHGIASYRATTEICESLGHYKLGELLDQSLADRENFCHELLERLRKQEEKETGILNEKEMARSLN